MNCPCWRCSVAVITKKCSNHEIFITKIYIHAIFSNFTKILSHENLELYGILITDCGHIVVAWRSCAITFKIAIKIKFTKVMEDAVFLSHDHFIAPLYICYTMGGRVYPTCVNKLTTIMTTLCQNLNIITSLLIDTHNRNQMQTIKFPLKRLLHKVLFH